MYLFSYVVLWNVSSSNNLVLTHLRDSLPTRNLTPLFQDHTKGHHNDKKQDLVSLESIHQPFAHPFKPSSPWISQEIPIF